MRRSSAFASFVLWAAIGRGSGLRIPPDQARRWATTRMGATAEATAPPTTASPTFEVEQFPALENNYGYLVHDRATGATAAVDTPEVAPIVEALARRGWTLSHILNTHHHADHTGGNMELRARFPGVEVIAPRDDLPRIRGGADRAVAGGDVIELGASRARVIDVGGHTHGHVAYHFADDARGSGGGGGDDDAAAGVAFVGDALFAVGCGRMFEGTPAQFWASLQRLAELPDATQVCCAHEYTEANCRFALSVEPGNGALQARAAAVRAARARGEPTVPTTLAAERATNPFLRLHSAELRASLGVPAGASDVEVFAACRKAKDRF